MANVLFFVAILQVLLGGLYGWFYWNTLESNNWQAWAFIFSSIIYFTLGFLVRWLNIYSLAIGFAFYLYLTFTIHALPYAGTSVWQDGLVLKLPILTFLLWGLLVGDCWEQPERKWKILFIAIITIVCGFGVQYAIHEIIRLNEWTSDMQGSLRGAASNLPEQTRMVEIVNVFCEAVSKALRKSTIAGCILGISGFGLCLVLLKLIKNKAEVDRGHGNTSF